jgi:hypothetical protein
VERKARFCPSGIDLPTPASHGAPFSNDTRIHSATPLALKYLVISLTR